MAATINAQLIQGLSKSFHVWATEGLEDETEGDLLPESSGLFLHTKSDGKEEEYDWFEDFGEVEEWIGERTYSDFKASGYTLKNKDWVYTIKIDRNDIEDDKVHLYMPRIRRIGSRFNVHRREYASQLLTNGFTDKGFDGVSFYNSAHPSGESTYSNLGNANLTPDSRGMEVLKSIITHMKQLRGANGRKLRIRPNVIVVPSTLMFTAKYLYEQAELPAYDEAGTAQNYKVPNEVRGMLRPIEDFGLATDTEYHIFDTSKSILKPFVYQLRRKESFDFITEGSEHNFKNKEFLYGGDARYVMGYGLPQLAFGSTGTGTTPVVL